MPLDYHFTCPLQAGLHARPATQLARIAARFNSRITLVNEASAAEADCSSVLSLVSAGVQHGQRCTLHFAGEDEAAARSALAEFIDRELERCDELPPPAVLAPASHLPLLLQGAVSQWTPGLPLSEGIALGRLVLAGGSGLPRSIPVSGPPHPDEMDRLDRALLAVTVELGQQESAAHSPIEREVLAATLAMLRDPQLEAALHRAVRDGARAGQAVLDAVRHFSGMLASSSSVYLRERVADVTDIGLRLLAALGDLPAGLAVPELQEPSIVCAPSLTPAQLLAFDRDLLAGLVLGEATATSHVMILARASGLPALGGVDGLSGLPAGAEAALDARAGLLITPLPEAARRYYEQELAAQSRRNARLVSLAQLPARTRDGRWIEVAANISTAQEAATAVEMGAEGIGLFRTEMLYSSRNAPPGEEEQLEEYRSALELLAGRPLIVRSFDVGGDKPLPYLQLPAETNPFLGYRGVRMYSAYPELIDAQLRAVCRASALGPVKLMAPMIATLDEGRAFHHRVLDVQLALRAEGLPFNPRMPLGVMLEVPSAALTVTQLATVFDFFSIGSNDLSQYCFAADRGNPKVADIIHERRPAFLRLLKLACDEARLQGRWIGLCGEMARDPRNAALLVGLGLDELSISAPGIPALKAALAPLDSRACRALLEQAVAAPSLAAVDGMLDHFHASRPALLPLATEELLDLAADCRSKGEVLRSLARLLYAAGRTDDPDGLEAALWAREAEFSTGLGHGMAIPHCKTSSVGAASLAVLRLREAVDWQALDGQPVDMVIMLTMPKDAVAEHLKVFAQLARKLMDEGFREALRMVQDPALLLELLERELELR